MSEFIYESAMSRNLGFMSEEEQDMLRNSSVAIAGAGGDGGMLAIQLARLGVGEMKLADPDPFEIENLNRQAACTMDTLNVNKAVAVGEYVQRINPDLKVSLYTNGITRENTAEFVSGTDLVIDETEFTIHSLGVSLAREARKANVPNLMAMNIGFGATVTSFHPKGKTFEASLGLSEKASLDEIDSTEVSIGKWLPYIPPYGDIRVLEKVASGEKSAPSIAPGVAIAAGIAASQALLHLTKGINNRPEPIYSPRVLVMDAMTGQGKIVRQTGLSYARHAAVMALRSKLGKNPQASY